MMIRRALFVPTVMGGGQTYTEKILTLSPIGYWILNEASGTTATDSSGNGYNGTYSRDVSTMTTGAGIGDGNTAPVFDGTNDYVALPHNSIKVKFNGDSGAAVAWCIVSAAGAWTDSTFRRAFQLLGDASNSITCYKSSSANTFVGVRQAAGTSKSRDISTSTTAWFCVGIDWSVAGDYTRVYFNGAKQGVDLTGNSAWNAVAVLGLALIGAGSTVPAQAWSGRLAHVQLYSAPIGDAGHLSVATV